MNQELVKETQGTVNFYVNEAVTKTKNIPEDVVT
jgi:hypothetical protein